jgi:hypothetical protein
MRVLRQNDDAFSPDLFALFLFPDKEEEVMVVVGAGIVFEWDSLL